MRVLLAVMNAVVFLAEIVKRWQKERQEQKLADALEKVIKDEDTGSLNDTLRNDR